MILKELIDYIKEEQARPENINETDLKIFDEIDEIIKLFEFENGFIF